MRDTRLSAGDTAYWEVGRLIVVEEQYGESRAEYAGFLLPRLAARLTREYDRGYTEAPTWYLREAAEQGWPVGAGSALFSA